VGTVEPTWLVSFRGRLNDDARGALSAAGMTVTGGHGGGTLGPGGTLPEIDHYSVWASAATKEDAERAVQQVLEPHGVFSAFKATPPQP
jgi:hypothetical protein